VLPAPVYALLTGLNAATVGIVVLAAVQLSHKIVTDRFTRAVLFLGASAGMFYNALWYFPVLMVLAGTATYVCDSKLFSRFMRWLNASLQPRIDSISTSGVVNITDGTIPRAEIGTPAEEGESDAERAIPSERRTRVSWKQGCAVIAAFLTSLIIVMVLRRALQKRPFLFSLFGNFYLAGTIIFGGGPVVIPLLRK
jgi:chromate transport protein ChrA